MADFSANWRELILNIFQWNSLRKFNFELLNNRKISVSKKNGSKKNIYKKKKTEKISEIKIVENWKLLIEWN